MHNLLCLIVEEHMVELWSLVYSLFSEGIVILLVFHIGLGQKSFVLMLLSCCMIDWNMIIN